VRMSGSAAAEALAPHVAPSHKLVVSLAAMLGILELNKANISYAPRSPSPCSLAHPPCACSLVSRVCSLLCHPRLAGCECRHDDLRALGLMDAVDALGASALQKTNYVFILQCNELPAEHVVYIPCYRGLKSIRLLKAVRLTEICLLRIGLGTGFDRKWPLSEAHRQQFRGVRVALCGSVRGIGWTCQTLVADTSPPSAEALTGIWGVPCAGQYAALSDLMKALQWSAGPKA
jgi:hypothetical protein